MKHSGDKTSFCGNQSIDSQGAVNARSGQICTHPYILVQNALNLAVIAMYGLQDRSLPYGFATHPVTTIMRGDAFGEDFSKAEH